MAATDYNAVVQQLYVSYFGRPADTYGLQNFTTQLAALDTGATLTTSAALTLYVSQNPNSAIAKLVGSFATAPESVNLYGTGTDILSISKFVNAIYNNVLHRDADTAGGTYWINEITSGRVTKANAALAITQGALDNTSAQGLLDAALVKNTAAAAADFTTSLDTIPKVNAYSGDVAASQARDLLKTVNGTTTAAAYHASVVAAINVLTAPPTINVLLTTGVDSLTGTGANDVYNAVVSGPTTTTFNALDSINGGGGTNTLVLTDTLGTGLDLSVATVTNIQNAVITSTGALAGHAADLTGWTGLTSASLNVKSGVVETVTVAATTALAVTNNAGVTTVGGSTVGVTANAANGAIAAAAAATASTAAAALATATTNAQTAANNSNGGAPTASSASTAFGATTGVSTTDAAAVAAQVVNGLTAVNAAIAAAVAAENLAATNAATAATAAATAAPLNNVIISGDSLTAASVVGGNIVTIDDKGSSTLTTVTINGAQGAVGLTGKALTNVNLAATATTVTITNATVGHTETITLNGTKTNTAIIDNVAKSVILNGTGANATVTSLTANAATSLTFGGDKTVTLTGVTAGLVTAVTVNGTAGFTAGNLSGIDAAAVITATASTGANKVTLGTGQSYLGGSGVDTVTITAAPTVAISGGAGTADVLVANFAGGFNASANTKLSGFETLALGASANTGNYDATGFAHLQVAGAVGTGTAFTNVAAGVDLAFSAAAGSQITYGLLNNAGTTDVLNMTIRATTTASGTNSLSAQGLETINIVTTDAATGTHPAYAGQLTLSDTALTTLKVSGSLGLTLVDTADIAITSVDASGITGGGFAWQTGALSATAAAVTIKGSVAGGDNIDASAVVGKGVTITETAGINTIKGSSTIGSTLTGGTGVDTIVGGAGSDLIIGGGGADLITAGAGADSITVSGGTATIFQVVGSSGVNNSTNVQVQELTSTYDIVRGATAGTKISLGNANIATAATTNAAGTLTIAGSNLAGVTVGGALVNDTAVFASGTYDAGSGIFTFAANGLDSALTYDSTAGATITMETIILVGYHATTAATGIAAGVITL